MLQFLILFLCRCGPCTSTVKKSFYRQYVYDARASQFYSFHSHQANLLSNYSKVYPPISQAPLPDQSDLLTKTLPLDNSLRCESSKNHSMLQIEVREPPLNQLNVKCNILYHSSQIDRLPFLSIRYADFTRSLSDRSALHISNLFLIHNNGRADRIQLRNHQGFDRDLHANQKLSLVL